MKWWVVLILLLPRILGSYKGPEKKKKPEDDDDDDDVELDPGIDEDAETPDVDDFPPQPGDTPLWMLPADAYNPREDFSERRPWKGGEPKTHHAGADLDSTILAPVLMPEPGTVIRTGGWAGPLAKAITVELDRGPVLIFGAMHPEHLPAKGAELLRGELVGRTGIYPGDNTMLHFELWAPGSFATKPRPKGPWKWGAPKPANLLDPTAYLQTMGDE